MSIKKTTDVLTEKPIVVRFGLLFFVIRPMTMAQIYEIGTIVEKTEGVELNGDFNPIVKMLEAYKDVKACSEVIVSMVFRKQKVSIRGMMLSIVIVKEPSLWRQAIWIQTPALPLSM